MTKSEIIDSITSATGLTRMETDAVVDGFMKIIKKCLADGERIEIRGFGAFDVKKRSARTARNPKTGEPVVLEEQCIPFFKPSSDMRELVNAEYKKRAEKKSDKE